MYRQMAADTVGTVMIEALLAIAEALEAAADVAEGHHAY